jgi:hypothetical protein
VKKQRSIPRIEGDAERLIRRQMDEQTHIEGDAESLIR